MKTITTFIPAALLTALLVGCGENTKGPEQQVNPTSTSGVTSKEVPPKDFIAVEKEPVIVKKVEPVYPELALKAGLEGKVWLKIWVDTDGKAKQVDVLKSDSDVFNQAAIDAAKQFLFTPAYMKGKPVAVWVSVPFKFKLADKDSKATPKEVSFLQGYIAAKEEALALLQKDAASARASGKDDTKYKVKVETASQELKALKDALKAMQGAK